MCWAEKCCYVLPANFGCVLLGICSLMISLFVLAASLSYFIVVTEESQNLSAQSVHFARALGLNLNVSSVHILLSIAIVVAFLWMVFSILLVVGVIKNKPNFVLCYFSYGIIVTIICQLSGLLLMLHRRWTFALILFTCSLIYIHFLVVVHTVYELMLKGTDFRFQRHEDDEDLLVDCFDGDTSTI